MKISKIILALTLGLFATVSFVSAKDVTKEQLADKWMLKSINNRNAIELYTYKTPYIMFNFDIDQISGNAGCNSFSGKINFNGGEVKAYNIENGELTCPGSSDEELLIKLLSKQSKLSIMNGELIFSQDNKPVMVFYRAQPLTAMDLAGIWKLTSIDGKKVNSDFADKTPTLEFDFANNRLNGNTGCNTYNTTYTFAKNVLEVNPLITTRMSCDNMKGEEKFVKHFTGRMDMDIENGELVLRKDNKIVMTFMK